jgi:prolyl-tRNA editing enzyme YbaK/EbsC (Cys-tRNA(Pro) deacylase)
MAKKNTHVSETPATQWLRQHGVAFTEHVYEYVEHGGTAESSRQLGVPEHEVVKTLVMQDEKAQPLIVLMHGDRQVSTSPFGTRKAMSVYVEASVLALPRICINGGRRGFLVGIDPKVLTEQLGARPVHCALG